MNISFDSKTAIVTGAGRGIGRAVAVKLNALGAKVVALSKSQSNLDSLKNECPSITTIQVDLSDWDETQEKLKGYVSNVDLLVNNAANAINEMVGDIKEDSIDSMFALNYKASVNLIQLVLNGMKNRRYGSIVNVSSISSTFACDGHCVYAATKGALDMLTKVSARELGKYNIRINSVNPTIVWTDLAKLFWSDEEKNANMRTKIPMGRFVEIEEVVGPIMFLLSDYAAMITGACMPIDGGLTT